MSLRDWMPTTQQMSSAIQLRAEPFTQISMRQSLGMILIAGLLGGLLPFLINWIQGATLDTVLPLAQIIHQLEQAQKSLSFSAPWLAPFNLQLLLESTQTLAGLPQPLPGWMAAFLSALGDWISRPLDWIQMWLGYGLVVALMARALGATMTLQRFFGATGYFAVPLVLFNLTVIPFIGGLFGFLIALWALVVYAKGVQAITGLDGVRVAASLLLPIIAVGMICLLFLVSMGLVVGLF